MKLFQIEEPEGGPADPAAPGAAVGIDVSGVRVEVACSIGGNAVLLEDREGFERPLPIPAIEADVGLWQELFEGARIRAERALARPVTHAVIVLAAAPDVGTSGCLKEAADRAGLIVLRLTTPEIASSAPTPALAAAVLAEDLAPRPRVSGVTGRG